MRATADSARAAELATHYGLCETMLRERDRDLWLAALFVPAARRRYLHALHAFTVEIGDARLKVTQPVLGEMRLRWWADTLSGHGEDGSSAHPVADALLDTITKNELDPRDFETFLDSRVADFYDDPMESMEALLAYCSKAHALPLHWCAKCVGPSASVEAGTAIENAGIALGLTQILRGLAGHPGGKGFLPLDLLARHEVPPQDIPAAVDSPRLRAALAELRALARARFQAAQRSAPSLDEAARVALLPAAMTPLYLERMEKRDYHPFQPLREPQPWLRQWRLWRAARAGL
ncbi:MAG: squalene/phytoene synthase family protein [Methylocystis sp.]